jgi:hypothetical protein
VVRRLGVAAGLVLLVLVLAATDAWATTLTIGPTATEGNNLQAHSGDVISAGYIFSMSNSKHPAATLSFASATVTLPVRCTSAGATVGSIAIALSPGPYSDPAASTAKLPSSSTSSYRTFQGKTIAPALCGTGNALFLNYSGSFGATFSADIQSTDVVDQVSVQFHYRDPAAKGFTNVDCTSATANPDPGTTACAATYSASKTVVPGAVTSSAVPVGAVGSVGLALVAGISLLVAERRAVRRLAAVPA